MSIDIIPDFVGYQIDWLMSHNDLEFEPVIEDTIVQMLKDTGKSFIDEQAVETSQFDHIAESDRMVSISCAHENDLVSRKAAIEALARMMPRSYTPDGSHPADEEIFRAQEIFADCIEALEILPSAQPEKRWIPCSKRMPNNYDYQLLTEEVHYTTGKIVRGVLIAYYDDEDDVWMSAEESPEAISYPIAWQPLPEAYRGGDA